MMREWVHNGEWVDELSRVLSRQEIVSVVFHLCVRAPCSSVAPVV